MQLLQEIITPALRLLPIIYNLINRIEQLQFRRRREKGRRQQRPAHVMLGLAGMVVGYYVGLGPANARASKANADADGALRQNANHKARAQCISVNLERIIDDRRSALTTDTQGANHLAQLHSLRRTARTHRPEYELMNFQAIRPIASALARPMVIVSCQVIHATSGNLRGVPCGPRWRGLAEGPGVGELLRFGAESGCGLEFSNGISPAELALASGLAEVSAGFECSLARSSQNW
jgi:hypothetical protein